MILHILSSLLLITSGHACYTLLGFQSPRVLLGLDIIANLFRKCC